MPSVTGRTIHVGAGESLQAAIDAAQPGDEIVLEPGVTYAGPITLRNKAGSGSTGSGWITIRSGGAIPAPGTRVTPAHAAQMPRILAQRVNEPAIRTESGASHYRLVGLEVTASPTLTLTNALITLGTGTSAENTIEKLPHHIVLDRMYVHGHPTLDFQRCVTLNSGEAAVIDSWLSECHGKGKDSQAIVGWSGPGPFLIQNNHLAGAGENVMFGGADPGISGLVPEDITIRRNHFTKPLDWKGKWTVKNLFELKNARRVLVEGNVFENNWADAQTGFALVWKSSASRNTPWTVVEDVLFRYNIVRNSPAGLNLASRPDGPAQPAGRIRLENNLFEKIGSFNGTKNGRMLQMSGDLHDIAFERNTFIHGPDGTHLMTMDGRPDVAPIRGLTFVENIGSRGIFGIKGSGSAEGIGTLQRFSPDGLTFRGNVIIGAPVGAYPPSTVRIASLDAVGFMNPAIGDYRLRSNARIPNRGADFTRILHETTEVVIIPGARQRWLP